MGLAAALVLATTTMAQAQTTTTAPRPVDVDVHGRVLGPDAKPAAQLPIVLTVERGVTEQIFGVLAFTFSLGLSAFPCLASPPQCRDGAQRTVTDGNGEWAFRLKRAWVPGTLTDTKWHVTAALDTGRGTAVTDMRFKVRQATPTAPDLRVWAPDLDVTTDARNASVGWSRLPDPGFEDPPSYEVTWLDAAARPIWRTTARGKVDGDRVDARVLEDATGNVAVVARANRWRDDIRYRFTFNAASRPFAGPAGPPPSRSKPCDVVPCRLTDGDLATPLGDATPTASTATVDMGAEVPVGLVVARGCDGCRVEGSRDGQTWTPLGTGPLVTPRAAPVAARWVRVTGGLRGLSELSVWPETSPPAPATGRRTARPNAGDAHDDRPGWLVILAVALLTAAATAVGATRPRRGSSRPQPSRSSPRRPG